MDQSQLQARQLSLRLAQASSVLVAVLVALALIYDVEQRDILLIVLSVVVANLPGVLTVIAWSLQRQAIRKISAQHVAVPSNLSVEDLAKTRYLLVEASDVSPPHAQVVAALKTAANAHIRVALFSDQPERLAATTAKQLFDSKPIVLTESVLARMKPKQLASMVDTSPVVFSQMSDKYKKHIAHALRIHGPTLLIGQKTTSSISGHLPDIMKSIRTSRQTIENFQAVNRIILTLVPALMILIATSVILLAAYDINPAITPLQIIGLAFIGLLPAWIMLGHDTSPINLMKHAPASQDQLTLQKRDFETIVGFGIVAAVLAGVTHAAFYALRNLDPTFLASDTPLYIQATTLTTITLLLCMYVHLLCSRVDTHKQVFSRHFLSNKKMLQAIAGSLLIFVIIMYVPALRVLLNLQPLAVADWLLAIFATGLFLAAHLIQRGLKKYSRHAVIQLHREVHGAKKSI